MEIEMREDCGNFDGKLGKLCGKFERKFVGEFQQDSKLNFSLPKTLIKPSIPTPEST
jgi:hypothetical protein